MELMLQDRRHRPFFGLVVEYVDRQRGITKASVLRIPTKLALPFVFSSCRRGEVPRAGPYAAFPGSECNSVWTDFVGTATEGINKMLGNDIYEGSDPYIGTSLDRHFVVPTVTRFPPGLTLDRLDRRRTLLEQFDQVRAAVSDSRLACQLDHYQEMALSLLAFGNLRIVLDVCKESAAEHEA